MQGWVYAGYGVCIGGLVYFAWKDIRYREIPVVAVVCYAVTGVVVSAGWYVTVPQEHEMQQFILCRILPALVIGLLLFAIGHLKKNSIGSGDAYIVMCFGLFLEYTISIRAILYGMLLAAVAGVILLVVFKKDKNTQMPFLPLLLVGTVISVVEQLLAV